MLKNIFSTNDIQTIRYVRMSKKYTMQTSLLTKKNYLKMDHSSKWKTQKLRKIKRKQKTNLHDLGLGKKFLDVTLKPRSIKKADKLDFTEIKNLCSVIDAKKTKQELMLSNCGFGEDSWESLGLQGDQSSQS